MITARCYPELPSWELFSSGDPLTAHVVRQMLLGITTRGYGKGLEPVPEELKTRGTSRSAVSRRFVASTEEALAGFLASPLGGFDLVALMIDGIHVDGHVMLVALGVDGRGEKRVLGLHEGATENETARHSKVELTSKQYGDFAPDNLEQWTYLPTAN